MAEIFTMVTQKNTRGGNFVRKYYLFKMFSIILSQVYKVFVCKCLVSFPFYALIIF